MKIRKMRFHILTIFPEAFESYLNTSILKRARQKKLVDICLHNIRNFIQDKHKIVDDKPYGGGAGMVLKIEPIVLALDSLWKSKIKSQKSKVKIILFSAAGKQFTQKMAREWVKKYECITMVAGRYEGVDERIKKIFHLEEISIGPYVLTGGELPAMIVIDAVSRHIPGFLGKEISLEEKRYGIGVPAYTRPEIFEWKGKKYRVPKVLLSGDHKKIEEWRKKHVRRI